MLRNPVHVTTILEAGKAEKVRKWAFDEHLSKSALLRILVDEAIAAREARQEQEPTEAP